MSLWEVSTIQTLASFDVYLYICFFAVLRTLCHDSPLRSILWSPVMEFDPKLSKQAKERINSKQNLSDTDAGEHVWPYFIYVYVCCFLRKKIGCKEK